MKKIHTNSITYRLCGSPWRATEQRRGGAGVRVDGIQHATGPPMAQASWKQAGKLQLKAS